MSDFYIRPVFQVAIPVKYFDNKYAKRSQHSCDDLRCKLFSEVRPPTQKFCGECGSRLASKSSTVLNQLTRAFHDVGAAPLSHPSGLNYVWSAEILYSESKTKRCEGASTKVMVVTLGVELELRSSEFLEMDSTNFSTEAFQETFLPLAGPLSTLWGHREGASALAFDLQSLSDMFAPLLKKKIDDFFNGIVKDDKVSCTPVLTLMPYRD